MHKRIGDFVRWLSLLVGDWQNIISSATTIAALLLGFLKLPQLLASVPREVFIGLAFVAFAFANYRVYKKVKRSESDFDFEITKSDGVGIDSEAILYDGQNLLFAPEIKFQLAVRLYITNVGAQTAVNFKFLSLHPIKLENVREIEHSLSKVGSGGGKLDNPYYFRQDDMSGDFQFRMKFSVDTKYLEETFGALSKVGKVTLTISATPTGRNPIEKSFECDLSSGFKHQIEERIPHQANQNLPRTIQAFNLMKRYWTGLEEPTKNNK